jgi:hypothetical protein
MLLEKKRVSKGKMPFFTLACRFLTRCRGGVFPLKNSCLSFLKTPARARFTSRKPPGRLILFGSNRRQTRAATGNFPMVRGDSGCGGRDGEMQIVGGAPGLKGMQPRWAVAGHPGELALHL